MTDRFAVRRVVGDDGQTLYWIVNVATGERLLSSVFHDSVARYADAMNRRHPAEGTDRAEAGSW